LTSDNSGATWTQIRSTTVPYLALACLPGTGTVIALDQGTGLYRSDDFGETWEKWSGDESAFRTNSDDYLFDLGFSADGTTAWAAIRGRGLWRRAL
jgi:photosystem II stability/assembly factor-like uncharacterized protein